MVKMEQRNKGEASMKQKRKAFCMIRIAEKKQKNASHKRLRVSAPYYPGKREMLGLALEILGKSCLYGIPSGILGGLIGCVLAALCK